MRYDNAEKGTLSYAVHWTDNAGEEMVTVIEGCSIHDDAVYLFSQKHPDREVRHVFMVEGKEIQPGDHVYVHDEDDSTDSFDAQVLEIDEQTRNVHVRAFSRSLGALIELWVPLDACEFLAKEQEVTHSVTDAEARLFRAANFQISSNDDYVYVVGPYIDLQEHILVTLPNEEAIKQELEKLWQSLRACVATILLGQPVIMIFGPNYDETNGVICIDLASVEAAPLVEVLEALSKQGWTTGIC